MGKIFDKLTDKWRKKDEPKQVSDIAMTAYQTEAFKFAEYPREVASVYPVLGLASEAGEVSGKLKKMLRGDGPLNRDDIAKELGDVLWYVAVAAKEFGIPLHILALMNLRKLQKRKEAGKIKGDGDER